MGILNLLKFLKPITDREHISTFRDRTLAVDALPLLYKGLYGCNLELHQDSSSRRYLEYMFRTLELLSHYNIKPILVFDGRMLSLKNLTIQKRKQDKAENREKALGFLESENIAEAEKYFARSLVIDDKMLATAFECLRARGVEFMVAPYEADSQLAKLVKEGVCDYALSEDSDLLAYGVSTIFKLNLNGQCDFVDMNKKIESHLQTKEQRQPMKWLEMDIINRVICCVVAGCDYLNNIRLLGIVKSVGFMIKHEGLEAIVKQLRTIKTFKDSIPEGYADDVRKTCTIFLMAKTYNPKTHQLEYLEKDEMKQQSYNIMKLSREELDEVVGPDYEYTQAIKNGDHHCVTMANRNLQSEADISEFLKMDLINVKNLQVHEIRNELRKSQNRLILQTRYSQDQIDIASGMYEQDEKRRREEEEERKKKKIQLNDFFNSLMEELAGQESEIEEVEAKEEDSEEIEDRLFQTLNPFAG